MKQTGT